MSGFSNSASAGALVLLFAAPVVLDRLHDNREPRLRDVSGEVRAGRRARAERRVGIVRGGRTDDELVVLEQPDRARVGAEELPRVLCDFL